MSLPKLILQIAISGSQIMGKAFYAAGQQAVKNAKYKPQGAGSAEAAGVSNAMSGSSTDQMTREHRMTVDEAHLILNVKRDSAMEDVLKNYEHLFKANSLPVPAAAPAPGATTPPPSRRGGSSAPMHSHYLQSKVVRALERLRAEEASAAAASAAEAAAPQTSETPGAGTPPPPPPSDAKAP